MAKGVCPSRGRGFEAATPDATVSGHRPDEVSALLSLPSVLDSATEENLF
jgi:hypothetical protein